MKEFNLPEIGENIEEAVVIAVFTEEGNFIVKDEPVVELETDKAAFDLPCPFEGKVESIAVSAGDKVKVGQLIAVINTNSKEKSATSGKKTPEKKAEPKTEQPASPREKEPVAPEVTVEPPAEIEKHAGKQQTTPVAKRPPSSPSAKSLAREMGIEITEIKGTGARGRVSSEDVKTHAKDVINSAWNHAPELPDFSPWGETEKVSVSTVRRISAQSLVRAWEKVPHVTHHDNADITELEDLRKNFSAKAEKAGGKLTVTGIIVKVVASALGVFPKFNSSFDGQNNEIILKKYINIGVAVNTERGLVVPVIKDVGKKNIIEISIELSDLAKRAREKNIKPDELQGSSFTVSNLGGIGGSSFTPIVNYPEVAILGLSRSKVEPVYEPGSGQFKPKTILPLSLSYDHRVIDGAEAATFSRWVAEAVEEPFKLVFEG